MVIAEIGTFQLKLQSIATSGAEGALPVNSESCELLRAIARQTSDAEFIHHLALGVRDLDALLDTAREHRALPMLFLRLAEIGSAAPSAMQERLRTEYDRNVFHNLANAVELIAVLKAFEEKAIPAMPFKGIVLGASYYGDFTTRAAGDLDVLIHHSDLAQATAILLERGYELTTPTRDDGMPEDENYYEYHFERAADGLVLELRWRLEFMYARFSRELGLDWVWPQRRRIKLAGADVPDISPEITLLILCMHGSKHVWSRLLWICDVAQLLRATPGLDWKKAIREAKKQGLYRALALGVLLAHRVAGAEVLPAVLRRFESHGSMCRMAEYIDENLFVAPGSAPPGRVPYTVQLLDLRDRLRFFLSLDSLRPNERDRVAFPLPRMLYPLYYLIRPIRLLLDRSSR